MKLNYLLFILFIYSSTACGSYEAVSSSGYYSGNSPTLTESLFASDQLVISQEAVDQILESNIEFKDSSKIAILKFPDINSSSNQIYGYGYWRSEDYLTLQQSYLDTLSSYLAESIKIENPTILPSLLTPNSPSIPVLREAAVRLQAPLLLVFRINSDLYENYRVFKSSEYKAFATVEMVLLDVRTGIIPFTSITSNSFYTKKSSEDINTAETRKRTVSTATTLSMKIASEKLLAFFDSK